MASMFRALSASVSMPSPTSLGHFSNNKKKNLPGDSWTIPVIAKFADSMKPTMEEYMKQWNSGALSALSVFNMLVSLNTFSAWKLIFGRKLSDLL